MLYRIKNFHFDIRMLIKDDDIEELIDRVAPVTVDGEEVIL